MDKVMEPLRVSTTTENKIEIDQSSSFGEDRSIILITPEQVDVLTQWLQEAKDELLKKVNQ
jgi:hypothetical protein